MKGGGFREDPAKTEEKGTSCQELLQFNYLIIQPECLFIAMFEQATESSFFMIACRAHLQIYDMCSFSMRAN